MLSNFNIADVGFENLDDVLEEEYERSIKD